MINVYDYMILWLEGDVSFVYSMATCAAQGSMGKKKNGFYGLLTHIIKKMCNMAVNPLKKTDYEMIRLL